MRDDPAGWSSIDVEALLTAWGFIPDPAYQSSRWGERRWIQENRPERFDLDVVLSPRDVVSAAVVLRVVEIVGKL